LIFTTVLYVSHVFLFRFCNAIIISNFFNIEIQSVAYAISIIIPLISISLYIQKYNHPGCSVKKMCQYAIISAYHLKKALFLRRRIGSKEVD